MGNLLNILQLQVHDLFTAESQQGEPEQYRFESVKRTVVVRAWGTIATDWETK